MPSIPNSQINAHNLLCVLLQDDKPRFEALHAVAELLGPRFWIGGSFIRNLAWDYMSGYTTPSPYYDIDVAFYNTAKTEADEKKYEQLLTDNYPNTTAPWSVKNQARMHAYNDLEPYGSLPNAVKHWADMPSCVLVRYTGRDFNFVSPYGLIQLFEMVVRPNPALSARPDIYARRLEQKGAAWRSQWPGLSIQPPTQGTP